MKRQRPVTSCLPCRKRRVRCDRTHPVCMRCSSGCVTCVYDESAMLESPEKTLATGSHLPSAASVEDHGGGPPNRAESRVTQQLPGQNSHENGQLSVHAGGRSIYRGSTYWANPIPSEHYDTEQTTGDELLGTGRPSTSWPPNTDDHRGWPGLNLRPPRMSDLSRTALTPNNCKLCGRRYNLSCMISLLPNRETCKSLCSLFFANVFPLIPLLHVQGFAEDFKDFWSGMRRGNIHDSEPSALLRKNPGFLCLLSSILFSALASTPKSRAKSLLGEDNVPVTGDMYFVAMVSATLTGFPRQPSIYSLAAYIFAQSQFMREEDFSDAPDFISTSFRVALGMGLHRHLPEAGFSIAETETRRRIWWYILHLDVMSSCSSGLSPLFIDEKMSNADPISQCDATDGRPAVDSEVDIRYLVAAQRYEVTKGIRGILKYHFEDYFQSLDRVNAAAGQLKLLADSINATVKKLLKSKRSPSTMTRTRNEDTRGQSSRTRAFDRVWSLQGDADDKEVHEFSSWAALLLHFMVHKAYCVLYRPLFRNPTMAAYDDFRASAVKHAQAFIQLFIRVCNDSVSEPFHWMYPGTYQPLQAVSLLLADLLQHPNSDHAPLSRGLIDAIFELYQTDEGIISRNEPPQRHLSPLGKDAWMMLARTRRKALEQIGADHHVLYPSSSISSSSCICGEKIASDENRDEVNIPSMQQHLSNEPSPSGQEDAAGDLFAVEEDQRLLSPGILGQMDFDWRAWDSTVGSSIGMMP